ncbi:GNAT family N-acetyltransferase [Lewinella sp. IMCC34183]|uniref:GNAT family N-acetyltransferase n=1 Tax=Lewinella sp. IMCC34183 TaxID=2248762 RepID=UPI000E25E2BE|nr:GNAT family N-acetyltransferase [Lewinella sp. IMCC34183]
MQVRRLRRSAIDVARWDAAVLADARPLPYGLSWWLDIVTAGHWDGLVCGEYTCVLPLPRMRRLGGLVPVLVRPPYTQQLGPYGTCRRDEVAQLLLQLPRSLQLSLPLRPDLDAGVIPDRFMHRRRTNYVLDLTPGYAEVSRRFPRKLQAYLRKCSRDLLEPLEPAAFVELNRRYLLERTPLTEHDLSILLQLAEACLARGYGGCYQLREEGEVLAAAFLPRMAGRTINLAAVTTDPGRKRRGMSRLLALAMREGAGAAGATFDFEGSELPGVREYFAKFGGADEGYTLIEERAYGLL